MSKITKLFSSLKTVRIEDIRWSSFTQNISTSDFTLGSFKQVFFNFVSLKRNRIIISSGIASLLLLSALPSDIEVVLNRQSTLSQFRTEDSLLEELQLELSNVQSEIDSKNKLTSSIFDLLPFHADAEKSIPIVLTNLLNSSSLRLIEIVPLMRHPFFLIAMKTLYLI